MKANVYVYVVWGVGPSRIAVIREADSYLKDVPTYLRNEEEAWAVTLVAPDGGAALASALDRDPAVKGYSRRTASAL